jgi:uncharacterized membrane protein
MDNGAERETSWGLVRTAFGRGLVVLIPVVITIWVLNGLFNAIDGIISPVFDHILGHHIPGLGFVSMILLIFFVGGISRNLVARAVFNFLERILFSIPLARTIYSAMKDLINAFKLGGKGKSFREVVLVEYPREGLYTVGFVTNEISVHAGDKVSDMLSIYIPNPPNPTSGVMILAPRKSIQILEMSVEEGLKLVLSGGIVTSGTLNAK